MNIRFWLGIITAILATHVGASAVTIHKGRIRPAAVAGSWYAGDAPTLSKYIDNLLATANLPKIAGPIRAIIAPHAGYQYSGATAAAAYRSVQGKFYKRVLILGPSHYAAFHGLSIADVDAYATPLGTIPLDQKAMNLLRSSNLVSVDPYAHSHEHSIEMQLPMLQQALTPGWQLVPLLVGELDPDDYSQVVNLLKPLLDQTTLVIVSSDFTHYGSRFSYQPFAVDANIATDLEQLDKGALAPILAKDAKAFLNYQRRTQITICGFRPINILLQLLPTTVQGKLLAYTTSGALTGKYDNSVSYMSIAFWDQSSTLQVEPTVGVDVNDGTPTTETTPVVGKLTLEQMYFLHALASKAVVMAVTANSEPTWHQLQSLAGKVPSILEQPLGAFVTLKSHGTLRGCIGYIMPIKPLYQAVMENGVNAAVNDHRFSPLTNTELADLEIEVSVLSKPVSIPSYTVFQVGQEGIILSKGGYSAVFLPEVATEQGWNREQTLNYLAHKAGLPVEAWRQPGALLQVFKSQKYTAPIMLQPTT